MYKNKKSKRSGKGKKRRRPLPKFLTQEEQEALLKVPNKRYATGERNYLFIAMLLKAGLRLTEAILLEWKDLDLIKGLIMVREGKGLKDRSIPINQPVIDRLLHWKERQAGLIGKKTNLVFTTLFDKGAHKIFDFNEKHKKTERGAPLQPAYCQALLKRYGKRAGIERTITPHILRHTFATDYYRHTKDIIGLQKLLGHSDLSTTMIYTHIVDAELETSTRDFQNNGIKI